MKNSLKTKKGDALICIHDVSPVHEAAIACILSDLKANHIACVNLSPVPNFHNQSLLSESPKFCHSLENSGLRVELLLHGYYHLRQGENERLSLMDMFKSKLVSAREDEFFRLSASEANVRIKNGLAEFKKVFSQVPIGFIPPAWMIEKNHLTVLAQNGIETTENHSHILFTRSNRRIFSPVFSYATRSTWREIAALTWTAFLKKTVGRKYPIRFVIHPHDYDSARTRSAIIRSLRWLSVNYEPRLYTDLLRP